MAHQLDETYGLDQSMVYVGDLPWHQHGTQIPPGVTVNEAIAACPAVDFETKLEALFYDPEWADGEKDGDFVSHSIDSHRVVVRSDTGAPLGVVGYRYSPIQIRDQWKGLDPLIEVGLAQIESMGSVQGGRRVWGLVRINSEKIPEWNALVDEVGEIDTYALTLDVKDGTGAAIIAPTGVRVVCKNTMEAATGSLTRCVRVPHIGDTEVKIRAAADTMWGSIVESFKRLSTRYRMLAKIQLHDTDHEKLVQDVVATVPTDPKVFASQGRFDGAVARAELKRSEVRRLWYEGAGHVGDGSAWEALNGAVECLDHNQAGAFRNPKGDAKIVSMLNGTEAQMKSRITRNLVEFAEAQVA